MPVDKSHISEPGLYFITFTNYDWLPLFDMTNSYDMVYKWFDHLKNSGHFITGYVIMPNHIHALIGFSNADKKINTIIGNAKRFLAYEIVKRLKASGNERVLAQLKAGVAEWDKRNGKVHEVFEPSFDMKHCTTVEFVEQKLVYIHTNPIVKKWRLAPDAMSYPHSSARFYETGVQGVYEVTNFMELF